MSTGSSTPFIPSGTVTLAASTTSVSGPLTAGDTVVIFNSTPAVAFVTLGNGSAVATPASFPIPPGGTRSLAVGVSNVAAVVLASGSGAVYLTAGTGTA